MITRFTQPPLGTVDAKTWDSMIITFKFRAETAGSGHAGLVHSAYQIGTMRSRLGSVFAPARCCHWSDDQAAVRIGSRASASSSAASTPHRSIRIPRHLAQRTPKAHLGSRAHRLLPGGSNSIFSTQRKFPKESQLTDAAVRERRSALREAYVADCTARATAAGRS